MVAPTTVAAVRHPAANMSDVLKGSGFTALMAKCIQFEMRAAGAYYELAAVVQRGIMRSGRRWLRGLDVVMTARRITRPIKAAGDNHMAAARALNVSLALYHQAFRDAEEVKSGGFNPTK